ncbi:MAG TPA: redoxin domain-containing protein, partial [Verrucomicrobiae bacterium]|nr:redoxin domain-containing protein [Verrucomicrobiae bacterium]
MNFFNYRQHLEWLLLVAFSSAAVPAATEIPDFALLDFKGRYHHLRQTDAKAVVLFFTANGCPVARQSLPKLRKLNEKFRAQGVQLWLVNSNSGDDRESISKESQEFHTGPLPVLIDETQGVAAALGVKRTGTAVCLETKNWTVFYQGAIDDQLVEGTQKAAASENYLHDALSNFLALKPI